MPLCSTGILALPFYCSSMRSIGRSRRRRSRVEVLVAMREMPRAAVLPFCFVVLFGALPAVQSLADSPDAAFGLEHRVPWTTSRVTGSPEPPSPFAIERIFPQLTFRDPVILSPAPGTERLFLVEVRGKVFTFSPHPDCRQADLAIDLAEAIPGVTQVYGLAFHPDFEQNRYCYICYVLKAGQPDGTVVSRFTVTRTDPPQIEPESEKPLVTWLAGGHNGGCLKFGPDGYLYITTGDAAGPNPPDPEGTGQDCSDLLSSILRIDVNRNGETEPYAIPADNPFVDHEGVRPEIWAYGFRNPWKISFDRATGNLWCGDVGWELWELVFRVERGGNYGWSTMEGRQPINTAGPRGPTPILPPTVDHPHTEAASMTGGYVSHGERLSELKGAYIYGDFETGKIWGLRHDGQRITWHEELVDTTLRIVAFGEDNAGEVFVVDYGGGMYRLVPNPLRGTASSFPTRLSETGLFASVAEQQPAAGVLPYAILAEPWHDHGVAERFVALPGESAIQVANNKWQFPADAVLVKTISLDRDRNRPDERRRIETQLLHFDGNAWNAYTYRWNDEQTDATLVAADGAEAPLTIRDPQAEGGQRQQTWHFASRAECLRCHNPWAGSALAFNTLQLNREFEYLLANDNQLRTLAHVGLLDKQPPLNGPKLSDPYDTTGELNERARSYLHANCAHCHRMHAGGSVLSQMLYDLPLEKSTLIGVRPSQGTFGIHSAEVVAAGDPLRSVLYYRMSKLGRGRMPHIGSNVVDARGVDLIYEWIRQLPVDGEAAQTAVVERQREESRLLADLRSVKQSNGGTKTPAALVEQLLSSTTGALRLLRAIEENTLPKTIRTLGIEKATQNERVEIRELFERFVPEEKRSKRLGTAVDLQEILALAGDAERGRRLYFETAGVQCRNCHRIRDVGKEVGPDLTEIGKKYDKPRLLESLLEPSKSIDAKYVTWVAETAQGRVHSGLLVDRTDAVIVLKDANNQEIRLDPGDIEFLGPQQKSLMPELLLRDMTAQEAADLIEFLSTLR